MRILLITGNHPRHVRFCNEVHKYVQPVGHVIVQREHMLPKPPEYTYLSTKLRGYWDKHFALRDEAESRHFGHQPLVDTGEQCIVQQGQLNTKEVLTFVVNMKADMVLIAGTDIIKEPLFSSLPAYAVNFHLGLIPWFKGSITMFWPFYFLEPQMAGCTYHVIDKLVDTGEILHQVVPKLEYGDAMHDVASKACLAAYDDVGLVINHVRRRLQCGSPSAPDPSLQTRGKTFTKKDWKPEMLEFIYGVWKDRIVDAYLDGSLGEGRKPKLKQLRRG